ncbi:MAG: aminopeptidase P N-terminal domain-containing protein [Gammaproteobacteria bacterium]|jgi:Xaa-Pro aminopeptidase|tara:strand:+ start:1622 stop:2917 length:1296 start_codon:yes stop_codon:yes gene_type:complete
MTDLNISIFKERRAKVASQMESNSILMLCSSNIVPRNNDTTFPFRQDSNFYYLTGFNEPNSVMLLKSDGTAYIFCRNKNPELEKWDGFMWGYQAAADEFNFDDGFDINDIDQLAPQIINGTSTVYALVGKNKDFDQQVIKWITAANSMERHQGNIDLKNFSNQLGMMRLVKEDSELSLMRKSCEIAALTHKAVISKAKVGMSEFDLETMYLNEFKSHGSKDISYTPIVAGGERACILHYIDNNQPIADGELVLVDAGCEWGLYASDITRTYPINGKFSAEQRAVYDVVLEAHNKACEAIQIGANCTDPQKASELSLSQGLKDLGLLTQSMDEIMDKQLFREFYYHKIGHWLGLDVHDDCPYSIGEKEVTFQKNMVMTIEPGIYVNQTANVDDKWKGIGIRIENDILATDTGYENLTSLVPSNADEIEGLMQ